MDRKKAAPKERFFGLQLAIRAVELVRLGLIEGSCYAKEHTAIRSYEDKQASRYCRRKKTVADFIHLIEPRAYDRLLKLLSASHPYLRRFIVVLNQRDDLVLPVISSMRDHVSQSATRRT